MVLGRDLERTIRLLHEHVDKLRKWGFPCAVAYGNKDCVLVAHGTRAITRIIEEHIQDIYDQEEYHNSPNKSRPLEELAEEKSIILPKMLAPLDKRSFAVIINFHLGNLFLFKSGDFHVNQVYTMQKHNSEVIIMNVDR